MISSRKCMFNITIIAIFALSVFAFNAAAAPVTGTLDFDKTVAVFTDSWGGGSSSTEIIFMTKQGASYQSADLPGTWNMNQIASGADAPSLETGTIIVDSNGMFQVSPGIFGSMAIDPTGNVTISIDFNMRCHMESGKTVFACTSAWDSGASTVLTIFTRKAGSYSSADSAGEWNFNILYSPGPYWERGTITIDQAGAWSLTGEDSTGATGLSANGTGATVDPSTGIMNITPPGLGTMQCYLDAGKTVAVCTQNPVSGEASIITLTKKASSCTQSDLTGTWGFHVLATPGPYLDRGTMTAYSNGGFTVTGFDYTGASHTESGTISVSPVGLMTIDNDNFHATPKYGFAPLPVSFTDDTRHNPTSWLWDFGDGATSTQQNPSHTYQSAGSFTVTLTATGPGGPVTVTKHRYIDVAFNGFGMAFMLPDTGQTTCYDTSGSPVTCLGTGQDGAYSINALSYSDNGDGTVTDNNTGLMWQKQDNGYDYNWYKAGGSYHATYNSGGMSACGSLELAGYDDWRLPTRLELLTLVNLGVPAPTITGAYFPSTSSLADYWTSTTAAADSTKAWGVSFNNGGLGYSLKSDDHNRVRCVRGVPLPQNFGDNLDGTVTDPRTGLMWQQGEPGRLAWSAALGYCEGLSLGGYADWRLPNYKELESVVDETRTQPAINITFFPGAHGDAPVVSTYWTSTTYGYSPGGAWAVDFYDGSFLGVGKLGNPYVRCVRGGQGGNQCIVRRVKIGGTSDYFISIDAAYNSSLTNRSLLLQAQPFVETLIFTSNVDVVLSGGYDCGFASKTGFSSITGSLTIMSGSATVEDIIIE